ncbi:MAG TPA: ABC transporter substrate-binding protein [Burkholderiales bacterium]|nr:ABC transporter substrate-binding protein [Burkholderiales bacterium]
MKRLGANTKSWVLAVVLGASSPALAAEAGISDTTILVGQSAAFSGPAAELGREMRDGAKAYFDLVNSEGGVFGRKIEMKSLDDGYEPDRAAANTKKLINEEKVFALIAYVGTPTSAAALPIFTEAKVPFVGPFTGAELLRSPFNKYIFNVRASYYDETEKIVEQLVSIGIKNIAVFYQNDNYGQAGLKGVEIAMKKRNIPISATGTVERNTIKVEDAVKAITKVKPDAVVMVSAYKSCSEFIRQMKKAGSTAQFYNVSFVGSKALSADLGADGTGVAISQVVPFPWSPSIPIVKEYQKVVSRFAPQSPYSFSTLEGYIAAKVFVEGLKKTGKDLTREKFIAALEKIQDWDLGGFNVNFSPANHNASKFVDLTIIGKDGKFLH